MSTAGADTSVRDLLDRAPVVVGALLAGQIGGVVVAVLLFKRVLTTRWMPAFAFSGVLGAAAAGVLLLVLDRASAAVLVAIARSCSATGRGRACPPASSWPA